MKVLFACEEQIVPPFVKSGGSSPIYAACLQALARDHEVLALGFDEPGIDPSYLKTVCSDHLILPAVLKSRVLKLARTLARYPLGTLQAPPWLEERGREAIKDQIRRFIDKHEPDVLLVQLFNCIKLLGQDVIREFPGIKIIDIHDDFVHREFKERQTVKALLTNYPALANYERYSWTRTKHLMTRLSLGGARREERAALRLFDGVLCANHDDYVAYSNRYAPDVDVAFSPWPLLSNPTPLGAHTNEFTAGFIATDHPFQLEGITMFIDIVLPQIIRRRPDFTFAIAGGVCAPLAMIYPNHESLGLRLLGRVESVADFYRSVATIAVPLLNGTGVSVKTLEAIAYGMRIVSTEIGVRGIPTQDRGPNVTVCDFTEFVEYLLNPGPNRLVPPAPWRVDRYLQKFDEMVLRARSPHAKLSGSVNLQSI